MSDTTRAWSLTSCIFMIYSRDSQAQSYSCSRDMTQRHQMLLQENLSNRKQLTTALQTEWQRKKATTIFLIIISVMLYPPTKHYHDKHSVPKMTAMLNLKLPLKKNQSTLHLYFLNECLWNRDSCWSLFPPSSLSSSHAPLEKEILTNITRM